MDAAPASSARRSFASRALGVALAIAVIDCAYLSWRYLALHGSPTPWVVAHTGLCSWSTTIDCDRVLVSAEARAFYVPNATLGLGFFIGAAHWWFVGLRRYPEHRSHLARTLAFWLGVATLFTARFWSLLVRLPALCPLCPWNHVFTYVAFAGACFAWREAATQSETSRGVWRALMPHVFKSIAPLFFINALWTSLVHIGLVDAGPTIWSL